MMNLDYEPARGKERELRAYREAGRYVFYKEDLNLFFLPISGVRLL